MGEGSYRDRQLVETGAWTHLTKQSDNKAEYAKHREYYLEKTKRYRQEHPDKVAAYRKLYYRSRRGWFAEYQKQYRQTHSRRSERFSNQHTTEEECDALLVLQEYRCAICRNGFSSVEDCEIDHDHLTGKVRGMLCRNCNVGIGLFKENPASLENAIKYLRGQ